MSTFSKQSYPFEVSLSMMNIIHEKIKLNSLMDFFSI
jgi:hypothetical protein